MTWTKTRCAPSARACSRNLKERPDPRGAPDDVEGDPPLLRARRWCQSVSNDNTMTGPAAKHLHSPPYLADPAVRTGFRYRYPSHATTIVDGLSRALWVVGAGPRQPDGRQRLDAFSRVVLYRHRMHGSDDRDFASDREREREANRDADVRFPRHAAALKHASRARARLSVISDMLPSPPLSRARQPFSRLTIAARPRRRCARIANVEFLPGCAFRLRNEGAPFYA